MQREQRRATLPCVGSAEAEPTRTVTVQLVQVPGPIRGQVADDEGAVTPFDGWLELTAALEDSRTKGGGKWIAGGYQVGSGPRSSRS